MKRSVSIILALALVLVGCTAKTTDKVAVEESIISTEVLTEGQIASDDNSKIVNSFSGLDDEALLRYVEDDIYDKLVNELDSEDYFVENVSAVYLSKEYLEELEYNSQSNIYFGYTVDELDQAFEGKKYVFTLGEDNTTVVKEQQVIDEASYYEMLKNVAVGTGVILICVTVSVATAGSAPAISMIFAASAKNATVFALSGAVISGVSTSIITGYQTSDFDIAIEAGLMEASENYKWGAITGVLSGGASEAIALKGATLNGLTMNEAAMIQKESGYPLDVIKEFKNMEQYNICKEAGLTPEMVNGKMSLVREIDINYIDELTGKTNLQLMKEGKAPFDPTGERYQLHHIGQKNDSTLAILTKEEHMRGGNNTIWHEIGGKSQIDRPEFDKIRSEYWKYIFTFY